jgi:cyanophycinase
MTIIAIGGAEHKTGDMTVLKRVLAETGKPAPVVMVITTASGYPKETAENYRQAFAQLGISPDIRHLITAAETSAPELLEALQKADVVFFSGGDQSKLGAVFGGSEFLETLRKRGDDIVIAGTSAGAAAMSSLMITGGDPGSAISSGAGLGLTPGIVFDTHFSERGRLSRLFAMAAQDNRKTGIGLDENTAIVLKAGKAEVVGSGTVTALAGGVVKQYRAGDSFDI